MHDKRVLCFVILLTLMVLGVQSQGRRKIDGESVLILEKPSEPSMSNPLPNERPINYPPNNQYYPSKSQDYSPNNQPHPQHRDGIASYYSEGNQQQEPINYPKNHHQVGLALDYNRVNQHQSSSDYPRENQQRHYNENNQHGSAGAVGQQSTSIYRASGTEIKYEGPPRHHPLIGNFTLYSVGGTYT